DWFQPSAAQRPKADRKRVRGAWGRTCVFEARAGDWRIRLQLAIYFYLDTGSLPENTPSWQARFILRNRATRLSLNRCPDSSKFRSLLARHVSPSGQYSSLKTGCSAVGWYHTRPLTVSGASCF